MSSPSLSATQRTDSTACAHRQPTTLFLSTGARYHHVVTALVLWKRPNFHPAPQLWAAADTRISYGDGHQVLTDRAPKIVALRIEGIHKKRTTQVGGDPEFVITLAIGYAGHAIGTLATVVTAAGILSRLYCMQKGQAPPSLRELSDVIRRIACLHIQQVGVLRPNEAPSGFVVFGRCQRSGNLEAFRFSLPQDCESSCAAVPLEPDSEVLIIGSGATAVRDALESRRAHADDGTQAWYAAPFHALQDVIKKTDTASVGGRIQLVTAGPFGVSAYAGVGSENQPWLYGAELKSALGEFPWWNPDLPLICD